MTTLDVNMNITTMPWDLGPIPDSHHVPLTHIGLRPTGTLSGRPTIALVATVEGQPVMVETTYRLLRLAMRAFAATPSGILADEDNEL